MSTRKLIPLTPEERQARQIAHDFANEGDCLVCGDLAHLIGQPGLDGKILRPCFEWERVVIEDEDDEKEPTTGGRWDGC